VKGPLRDVSDPSLPSFSRLRFFSGNFDGYPSRWCKRLPDVAVLFRAPAGRRMNDVFLYLLFFLFFLFFFVFVSFFSLLYILAPQANSPHSPGVNASRFFPFWLNRGFFLSLYRGSELLAFFIRVRPPSKSKGFLHFLPPLPGGAPRKLFD